MQVTIGLARSLGWKVHMRCAQGDREGMKAIRRCVYPTKQRSWCGSGANMPRMAIASPSLAILFELTRFG